ncbi:unnamed protein product [Pedinophyceae sp. YPF-701]|nr:unnamed protein product [Pedinophyceae sp. YPF-701]
MLRRAVLSGVARALLPAVEHSAVVPCAARNAFRFRTFSEAGGFFDQYASSSRSIRTATRCLAPQRSASTQPEDVLSGSEIQRLLDEAGVDYRDCLEKSDLISRLRAARPTLPAHVQYRLEAMIAARNAQGAGRDATPGTDEGPSPAQDAGAATPHPYSSVGTALDPTLGASAALTPEESLNVALFKRCAPSVVHVATLQAGVNPFTMDVERIPRGSGTGFCWDAQGHIVTNYHVVAPPSAPGQPSPAPSPAALAAQKLRVTLADGTALDAAVVGVEPAKDLAVLRVKSPASGKFQRGLHPISVGTSSGLQVGQKVLAIGNPFGLDQTLTQGIVSGLGREIRGVAGNPIRGLVQTDAAINPGNSGGPLLDSHGRLIGVNTMIFSTSGSSAGIGFAIPSDTVRRVVVQLIRYGRVRKANLGLYCLTEQQSRQLGAEGVVVHTVIAGSGAADAGLRGLSRRDGRVVLGDEILAIGGEDVRTFEDLQAAVERFDAGDVAMLTVKRAPSGKRERVEVRLQERVE